MKRFINRLSEKTRGLSSKAPEFNEDFPTLEPKQNATTASSTLENLNRTFRLIVFYRTKSLFLGSLLCLFLNLLSTTLITFLSSEDFILAYYYSPLCALLLTIWVYIRKSSFSLSHQLRINAISFILFGGAFVYVYLTIFAEILPQTFSSTESCSLHAIYSDSTSSTATSSQYTIAATSFVAHDGVTHYGCACVSPLYRDSIFERSPKPYAYYERNDEIGGSITSGQTYDLSDLKLPSWFCAESITSITGLEDTDVAAKLSANTPIPLRSKCYINYYLGTSKSTSFSSTLCTNTSTFPQVIFQDKPYYDTWFLHVMILIVYTPFFAYSFNWVAIITVFVIRRKWRRRTAKIAVSPLAPTEASQKSNNRSHKNTTSKSGSVRSKQVSQMSQLNHNNNDSISILDNSQIDNSILDHSHIPQSVDVSSNFRKPRGSAKHTGTTILPPLKQPRFQRRKNISSTSTPQTPM